MGMQKREKEINGLKASLRSDAQVVVLTTSLVGEKWVPYRAKLRELLVQGCGLNDDWMLGAMLTVHRLDKTLNRFGQICTYGFKGTRKAKRTPVCDVLYHRED